MFINNPWSKQERQPSFGENLATGLSNLADYKVNSMRAKQEQQQKSAFWQQAGLSPEFASALASQPEAVQKSFLDRLEGLQIPGGQQQSPQMQQQQTPQQGRVNQAAQPARVQAEERALRTLQHGQEAQQLGQMPGQINQPQGQFPQTPPELPSEAPEVQGLRLGANPLDRRQREQFAHAERLAEKKAELREKHEMTKFEREKQEKEQQKSKEYLTSLNKEAKGIKENQMRLDKMEKLIEGGNISNPAFSAAIDTAAHGIWGLGINLKHLQSADTQEFEKLSKDMLNGLKDTFGSRILESEVQNFLLTIPTLSQSNEGKKAVIDNMRLLGEGKLLRQKAAREIVKENNNVVPQDLELLVDEKVEPELDALSNRFKNSTHAPVKESQSLIGSAVRAIPKLIF